MSCIKEDKLGWASRANEWREMHTKLPLENL